jgi:hypothetical protein
MISGFGFCGWLAGRRNKKPGAEFRPGADREFQFQELR